MNPIINNLIIGHFQLHGHTIWHLIRARSEKRRSFCTRIIQCENGQDEQKKKKYRKID